LLAAAAYAHPAGRGLFALPAVSAIVIWLRSRRTFPARGLALATALALALVAPLALHWQRHPDQFTSHATEVSVMQRGPAAIATNAARVGAMFTHGGDPAPWRNLVVAGADDPNAPVAAGRPVFDPVTGLLFLIACALTLLSALRGVDAAWLVIIWTTGLLLPSILTDSAPNWSRAIGALPFVVMLPALAAEGIAAMLPRRVGIALWGIWLALAGAWTVRVYFVEYAPSGATALAFDADKVALGAAVRAEAARGCIVAVEPDMARHPTVEIAAGQDVRAFKPAGGAGGSPEPLFEGAPGQCISLLWRTDGAIERMEYSPDRDVPPSARSAEFGGALRLTGADVSDMGGWPITVTTAWQVIGDVPAALSMFVHARDQGGTTLAQWDGAALGDLVRPDELRLDERFTTTTVLDAPTEGRMPSEITVGWYDWRDGTRLTVATTSNAGSLGGGPHDVIDDGTALRLPGGEESTSADRDD
jgi:hypothetical protein